MKKPELFEPFLEARKDIAEEEVAALAEILRRHEVPEGGRILDLACGIGRHSVLLAKRGYDVVGVDISPRFLQNAQDYAATQGVVEKTTFLAGDMRQVGRILDGLGAFDAILNAWTSMGYYGEESDRDIFAQLAAVSADGAVLVIQTVNRDWILKNFESHGRESAEDIVMMEDREFDVERSHMVNRWTFFRHVDNDMNFLGEFTIDHRVYSPHELRMLIESAGWRVASLSASLELVTMSSPFPPSRNIVLVAWKA
ncbi:MAG: class I SAM-dependent methyltransferase [Candidatus Thermoplasmatota archaeon]|nr:class I SAM-dependent methyltransferase [Candidatus Thermoplasmatota archaeon]